MIGLISTPHGSSRDLEVLAAEDEEDAVENPILSGGVYVGGLGGGGRVGGLGVLRSKGLDAVTRTLENLPGAQMPAGR